MFNSPTSSIRMGGTLDMSVIANTRISKMKDLALPFVLQAKTDKGWSDINAAAVNAAVATIIANIRAKIFEEKLFSFPKDELILSKDLNEEAMLPHILLLTGGRRNLVASFKDESEAKHVLDLLTAE